MNEFNKLEKLLNSIVQGYSIGDDGTTLSFAKGNNDILIIFSRKEDLSYGFIDCVLNHDYTNKFEFDAPMQYIDTFIRECLWNSEPQTNFLLRYPEIPPRKNLDEVYDEFLKKINDHPKFYSIFLPAVMNENLQVNDECKKNKRPKI